MEAFTEAVRAGVNGLESDVWVTADGVAVLDHDGLVGRRPRRRAIAEARREELPGHIPTLAELYDEVGDSVDLSLDIKDPAAIEPTVLAARRAGAESRLWVCHPDRELLVSWRLHSADVHLVESIRLTRMIGGPEAHIAESQRLGVDVVNMHHRDWSGGLVALAHRFGLLAFAWDAQFERILDELLDSGIDGVYSDHVDRLTAALSRL